MSNGIARMLFTNNFMAALNIQGKSVYCKEHHTRSVLQPSEDEEQVLLA